LTFIFDASENRNDITNTVQYTVAHSRSMASIKAMISQS
jgi:hypothetical protein